MEYVPASDSVGSFQLQKIEALEHTPSSAGDKVYCIAAVEMEPAKQNADTLGIGSDEEAVAPELCLLALLHCTALCGAERQIGT